MAALYAAESAAPCMFRLVPYQVPTSVPSAVRPSSTVRAIATVGTTEPERLSISRTHAPRKRRASSCGDERCAHAPRFAGDALPRRKIFNTHRSISPDPIIGEPLILGLLLSETGLTVQRGRKDTHRTPQ